MKKLIFLGYCILLFGCNNQSKPTDQKEEVTVPATKIELPYKLAYDGTVALGKPENIVTVMHFNGDFIAGKVDSLGSYLADSVHLVLDDGSEYNSVRDTIAAMIKSFRVSMTGAHQSYILAVALENKDKGHEWVFQWIDETHDFKDGKKDHKIYHEDYRLENGKIRELFQYSQAIPQKK